MSKKRDNADQLLKPDANIGSWAEEDDDFGMEGRTSDSLTSLLLSGIRAA